MDAKNGGDSPGRTQVFHLQLGPIVRLVLIGAPLATLAYAALRKGGELDPVTIATAMLISIPVILLIVVPAARLAAVRVGPGGIVGQDAFGPKREARWEEIDRIDTFSFGGMHYWRAHRRGGGRSVLVPMFLRDRDAFVAAVAEYAGQSNPLAVAARA